MTDKKARSGDRTENVTRLEFRFLSPRRAEEAPPAKMADAKWPYFSRQLNVCPECAGKR